MLTLLGLVRKAKPRAICFSTKADPQRIVLGCGSNVVDQFFMVKAVPNVGEKGYFKSPTKIWEKSVVGGVTLNHLSWASLLGVPTGLLALQGDDSSGKLVRSAMKQLGVSTEFIQVKKNYTTAESYIFVQEDGERSILMATGATSQIDDAIFKALFDDAVKNRAAMLTTEISQVPLSGVLYALQCAKEAGITTVLDLDVSPSVAISEAGLGSKEELLRCVKLADVLKPAKHAAQQVIGILDPELERKYDVKCMPMKDVTLRLQEVCKSKLVAVTCGKDPTVVVNHAKLIEVPTVAVDRVVDTTGAGDAFLGGLVAGLYFKGLPDTEAELREIGELANKTGSACTQVLGALPDETSRKFLQNEINMFVPERIQGKEKMPRLREFTSSLHRDADAATNISNMLNKKHIGEFIDILSTCSGRVLTSALGKSGVIAERMAKSLASTGTPAHFVHAAEWTHGDLGNVLPDDVVVFLSHSGNTTECAEAAKLLNQRGNKILALVGKSGCQLEQVTKVCLCYDKKDSLVEPHGGVPTSSIVLQEMLVNAVVCELMDRKEFTKNDFYVNHPGGSIGRTLSSEDA